jgi:hypothetical protein
MNSPIRVILYALPLVAVAAAFWFLALSPKREEASKLEGEVADLQAQVEEQEQFAAMAEAARKDFPRAYRRLVVLGKATPSEDDTSSLLVQLQGIADDADVEFLSLQIQENASQAAPPPTTEPQSAGQAADASEERVAGAESGSTPAPAAAPATEATAALLPIGASIGPAGLPVMKYTLVFTGDFFHLADFVEGLDDLVTTRQDGHLGVKGRLVTVDGFTLVPEGEPGRNPTLNAQFQVTTFVTPPEEGTTGGATPTGPAPPTEPQTVDSPTAPSSTETASTTTP